MLRFIKKSDDRRASARQMLYHHDSLAIPEVFHQRRRSKDHTPRSTIVDRHSIPWSSAITRITRYPSLFGLRSVQLRDTRAIEISSVSSAGAPARHTRTLVPVNFSPSIDPHGLAKKMPQSGFPKCQGRTVSSRAQQLRWHRQSSRSPQIPRRGRVTDCYHQLLRQLERNDDAPGRRRLRF